tara:strand:- start:825 stop:1061 length:237 start_codon:yes stop_codon:yes gene_type:complete
MQKIINVLAIASSVVSLTVVGGGVYLYVQKDAIIENIKEKALGSITSGISDALPGIVDASIPDTTGGTLPEVPSPVKF